MHRVLETGWYADIIPKILGEYCIVEKDQSKIFGIPFLIENTPISPNGFQIPNILFLRYTLVNGLYYLAGQGSDSLDGKLKDGNCWVKNISNKDWVSLGPTFGVSPIIFYRGQLYVVRNSSTIDVYELDHWDSPVLTLHQPIGTQGIRFIDGDGIHSGDSTYDGSHLPQRLAEWTKCLDVYFGQSYIDGAIAVFNFSGVQVRKVLEPGDCRWIRAYSIDSDNFAIAIVKQPLNQAVLLWISRNEMLALDDEQVIIEPPNIPPSNPPNNPMPQHEDVVKQLASQNPIDNSSLSSIFTFTQLVVGVLSKVDGCGFEAKEGENVFPYKGRNVSISRVMYPNGQLFKILGDAGPNGANSPQWATDDVIDPSRYISFDGSNTSEPPSNPPPNNPPSNNEVTSVDQLIHQVLPTMRAKFLAKHGVEQDIENVTFQLGRLFIEHFTLQQMYDGL